MLRSRLSVATTDAEWRFDSIGAELEDLLGYAPGDLLGTSLLHLAHPGTIIDLLYAIADAYREERTIELRLRMRHADGGWPTLGLWLTPLGSADGTRLAVVVTALDDDEPWVEDRAARLESHLRRIAVEVQASGIVQRLMRLPDVSHLVDREALSDRQWEIVTRLLDGERVPAIARALYLSPSTVRNHLSMIFRRFDVHSQSELLDLLRSEERRTVGTS